MYLLRKYFLDSSKLISNLFLSFSIILLLYVVYRAEFYHSGTKFDFYIKYYLASIALIVLSIISYYLRKEIKIKILTILIATFLIFYFIEGYIAIRDFVKKNYREKVIREEIKKTGIKYDDRTKWQVYLDLKKEDPNVVIATDPYHFLNETNQTIFPLASISNKKTISCNENGYHQIYQSDRYGFNNLDNEWDKKQTEFLLVGDRFTVGDCVNEPDTIGGNLKKFINNKGGVLNLGQGGNGPLMEYATLREYLPITNTKRVIWIYCESNDLVGRPGAEGLKAELNNKILLKYLNDQRFTQNLHLKQKEIDTKVNKKLISMIRNVKQLQSESKFFKFIKLFNLRKLTKITIDNLLQKPSSSPPQTISPEFKKIIILAKNFVEKNGANFYFVYLTERERYFYKDFDDNLHDYRKVVQFIKESNIPIIDINKELFQDHKDPLSLFPFRKDRSRYHYNELGYKLVANAIFKKISEFENLK